MRTVFNIRYTFVTIAAMMAIGYVTRYCGLDATLGLAFARTGSLYPFFGTLIGWLGTASTGSDTAANVLFGSLQRMTARQIGVSPVLMSSANAAGGVMGKMIAAPSVVVASTATQTYGQEGRSCALFSCTAWPSPLWPASASPCSPTCPSSAGSWRASRNRLDAVNCSQAGRNEQPAKGRYFRAIGPISPFSSFGLRR